MTRNSSSPPGVLAGAVLLAMAAGSFGAEPTPPGEAEAGRTLRELGGQVFLDLSTGRIHEINLNGLETVRDEHLKLAARCPHLTDLSLESTAVTDAGLAHLRDLRRLEWLNLYRTRITDEGLAHLAELTKLQRLPLGETAVTDAGLPHLASLPDLAYLGLRGTAVTEKGLRILAGLPALEEIHLGQTSTNDAGLAHLAAGSGRRLKRLWLHDTYISDAALRRIPDWFPRLEELHIQRTSTTAAAVKTLRESMPGCRVWWESEPAPE